MGSDASTRSAKGASTIARLEGVQALEIAGFLLILDPAIETRAAKVEILRDDQEDAARLRVGTHKQLPSSESTAVRWRPHDWFWLVDANRMAAV
jgi:hypothetical protein